MKQRSCAVLCKLTSLTEYSFGEHEISILYNLSTIFLKTMLILGLKTNVALGTCIHLHLTQIGLLQNYRVGVDNLLTFVSIILSPVLT